MDKKELYKKTMDTFGIEKQTVMVFEEMSELQKELCKALRGNPMLNNIAEEIGDLEIMLEQMKEYYKIEEQVEECKAYKRGKLEKTVHSERMRLGLF